ncbi:hypothetical protein [Stenotrophomonas maltophilia]|uniref:hypothetical protein n=1 Tax=Stenotrophomonas maltophilia TaxID=40324 RepID=UPI0015DE677B|nr:hypothetical protein [Stenotrophomonas maltophilia]
MERERPEYLQPIPRSRWEFPWLGMWAVLLLAMAGAGIWLHVRTGDAWNARFQSNDTPSIVKQPSATKQPASAEKDAFIAEIRERRERAEVEASMTEARLRETGAQRFAAGQQGPEKTDETRCINGIAFRRIPGGWENVPGAPCP